jgi:RimJ/RimL family protein N-acetyltransferase/cytochrome b561
MNGNARKDRPGARYSAVAQVLHWATAVLVLVAFIYGPGGSEERVYSPARDFDRQIHETLGLSVLALVAIRVARRMVDVRPSPAEVARWMGVASKSIRVALYLLFAVPLTAIAGAWLEGHPVTLVAGIEIAPALARSHDSGATIASPILGSAILSCGSRESMHSQGSIITLSSRMTCLHQCFRPGFLPASRKRIEIVGRSIATKTSSDLDRREARDSPMEVAQTERLILRWLDDGDSAFILELLNEPSWIRFIGDKGVKTIQDAQRYIETGPVEMYRRLGFGLYLVELKENGAPIGICGLIKRAVLVDADLGFAFLPRFWANGYAFESASAVMSYARSALTLSRIVAILSPDNHRSAKLLAKLGFRFDSTISLQAGGDELELYAAAA